MLTNGKPPEVKIPLAEAAEVLYDQALEIQKKSVRTDFSVGGRKLHFYEQHFPVRGSEDRPVGTFPKVYRDHVGRFTLEPLGEAVGVLMRGGTNGRLCIIGFFEEVNLAKGH